MLHSQDIYYTTMRLACQIEPWANGVGIFSLIAIRSFFFFLPRKNIESKDKEEEGKGSFGRNRTLGDRFCPANNLNFDS